MTEPYRFGGPIPESVQRMKARRAARSSHLTETSMGARLREFTQNVAYERRQFAGSVGSDPLWPISALRARPNVCPSPDVIGVDALGMPVFSNPGLMTKAEIEAAENRIPLRSGTRR